MSRRMLLVGAVLLATACTTAPQTCPLPEPTVYSAEFLGRAADELAALPEDSRLAEMIEDYARLVGQVQAARYQR